MKLTYTHKLLRLSAYRRWRLHRDPLSAESPISIGHFQKAEQFYHWLQKCGERSHPTVFTLLDTRYFERLQGAGEMQMATIWRGAFVYAFFEMISKLTLRSEVGERRLIRQLAGDLERAIEASCWPDPFLSERSDYLSRLRRWTNADRRTADVCREPVRLTLTKGKLLIGSGRSSFHDARSLLSTLEVIYELCGGHIAFPHKDRKNFDGPYPRFLAIAWEAIPLAGC